MLKGQETNLLWELKAAVDTLKLQMVRVKTKDVKDDVDKVARLLFTFTKLQDELGIEWRERIDCVNHKSAAADKITHLLEATEEKITSAFGTVSDKVAEHNKCPVDLSEGGPLARRAQPPSAWREVVRKA